MKKRLPNIALGMVLGLFAAVPAFGQQCGDLNNDGARSLADLVLLNNCANGACPGNVCGNGNLLSCGDIFGDGDVSLGAAITADLAALGQSLAGQTPVYDLCEGPGPDIDCPGGTVTLGTPAPLTITSSQTWPADCTVRIGGTVFVDTPAAGPTTVLKIEAGSIVHGIPGTTTANPAALIVLSGDVNDPTAHGGRVDFQGTESSPIIFTSDAAVGNRNKGDWGGVMINGRGPVNGPDCKFQTEGLPTAFGGCNATDNSGVANFVRVEFAGLDFTANNELNLFTMNGIGSQTRFNNIQAHNGDDDCLEWFGGTSSHTNMVASSCGDDGFDFQLGFTGSLQFGLMVQNGQQTDTGRDARGIEGDNSEFDNNASPRSDPDMCNITLIGGSRQAGANDGSDAGILLRRGARATIANAIVTGFNDAGVELRDVSTTDQACNDANNDGVPESIANVIVRNSVFFDNGSNAGGTEHPKDNDGTLDTTAGCDANACAAAGCNCDTEAWYALLVSGFNVRSACGSNAVDPGVSAQFPPLNTSCTAAGTPFPCCTGADTGTCDGNNGCTGAGVPFPCCTGAGAGSCNLQYDFFPTSPLADPPPVNCNTINPLFVNTNYIGAFNPAQAAACNSDRCGWLSAPWISFRVN
ncbi:MAG: hypothetical protein AB7V27_12500 [Candidatus Binatia bacterium]